MNHKAFAKKMSHYSILYVEDDPNVRKQIREFLLRYSPRVYSCESSEEGLELYQRHKPDILLLDINLPNMNGIDFATKIRKYDKETRIIISTAYTNPEFTIRAVELELCRYLVKPVTNEELLSAFEKALNELKKKSHFELGKGYVYDKKTTSIIYENSTVLLRKKESEILEFFIEHEGEVLRYDMLETEIWSSGVMTRDAIRSQIRNIRKKMVVPCLKNITGMGYRFEAQR
jgi:DNA-binding response OmpR family regulator